MTLFEHIASEMPLVVFTILFQAVVGLAFVYTPAFVGGHKNMANLKSFGLIFGICGALAMLPSIFHLGDVFNAFNVIRRVGVFYANNEWHIGWLNNEIVFSALACGLGILLYFKPQKWLIYAIVACGFLALFFMSGIYGSMESSIPTWSFKITLIYFFSSAFFLGAIVYYCFFEKSEYERKMAFLVGLVAIGILSTSIVFQTLHVGSTWIMGVMNPFDILHGAYGVFIIVSMSFLGLAIVSWYLHNYLREKFPNKIIAYISLVSAFIGVFATRILFYGLISTQIMIG